MTLIKSISGTRGTIGGMPGSNLTPIDIAEITAAYGTWLKSNNHAPKVVVGRDARISGAMVSSIAIQTLVALGIDVVDLGLSTTPTVEMAVTAENAGGGIIFTASHNPENWNALKFLNNKGEFISHKDGEAILNIISKKGLDFCEANNLGSVKTNPTYIEYHVEKILDLSLVQTDRIKNKTFKVAIDAINSTGSISIPVLLNKLGVAYEIINGDLSGQFAHNPEPLPKHLMGLATKVQEMGADFGIAVDPDVDRLVFVCEDGSFFGEEYTLVAIADYVLSKKKGNTVSNLSSTRALSDVTKKHGSSYFAAAVGEVNVVESMKQNDAVIGGEGNGGIILPELHYGRDALVGIALLLSHLAETDLSLSELKNQYPKYEIIKNKIDLHEGLEVEDLIDKLKLNFQSENLNEIDGLKIDFKEGWVHLRKSNTEPIIRVYAEASDKEMAQLLISKIYNALDL